MNSIEDCARRLLAEEKEPGSVGQLALLSEREIPKGSCDWQALNAIMKVLSPGSFYVTEYVVRSMVDGVAEVSLNRNALTDWPDWAQEFQRDLFAPGAKLPSVEPKPAAANYTQLYGMLCEAVDHAGFYVNMDSTRTLLEIKPKDLAPIAPVPTDGCEEVLRTIIAGANNGLAPDKD